MGKGSFVPSISVDGCIIEEQDDHLVLAIRVPKATIASNMALFAAMADCCGSDHRVWSTRADPPLRSNRRVAIGAADPIFAAIDDHREKYTAVGEAADDYDADPEEKEEGPIADRLSEAGGDERQTFWDLLAAEPRMLDGWSALFGYVGEVARRQEEKGHHDDGPEMLFANLRKVAAVRGSGRLELRP
jgi:hypothetical protein